MSNNQLINQSPLFDLSHVDFFNLQIKSDNKEWENFFEEMLLFQYYNFRNSHINNNIDAMLYFLHLVEGKFMYNNINFLVF